jgi:diguanylate cyclase (GGDEF)-like protein
MEAMNLSPKTLEEELRVLIVEDNPDDAEMMCAVLEDEGFEVEPHRIDTPPDLIRALDQHWDLILCDYSLPRLGATEVLRILREHKVNLPLVLVSGLVSDDTVVELMHHGVRDFVPKRNMRLLGPVVRRALECSRPLTPAAVPRQVAAERDGPDWRRMCPQVDRMLAKARNNASRVAVVTFDVDRFHRVNNGLGYEQGEQLLSAIAERVAQLSGTVFLGRMRGDEYLVALEEAEGGRWLEGRVTDIMARLRRPYRLAGLEINVTFSAGVALYPDNGSDGAALLREAEAAMFEAKRLGRGTFHVASCQVRRSEGLQLEHELYRALDRGQFHIEYQPQVDMISGRLLGVEALLRWDHPDLGRVPPARFIPIAEESGEILRIGTWVLRNACATAQGWRQMPGGEELRVGVNLSARQFLQQDVLSLVRNVVAETKLEPHALDLELTETVLISDADEAVRRLNQLRDLGTRTSVDDFGTGYSSLSYLRRLPLDVLKIDRSFVIDLTQDKRAASVVSALVGLGNSLGMEMIAEGVETRSQADALLQVGCRTAQGYLFGRPVTADKITGMLGLPATA